MHIVESGPVEKVKYESMIRRVPDPPKYKEPGYSSAAEPKWRPYRPGMTSSLAFNTLMEWSALAMVVD
jgi:hypothetical protein